MTTFADILALIKAQARITGSSQDVLLGYLINESYSTMCRNSQWTALRKTSSFTTAGGTQDYNLASDFDRLIDNSVRYYTPGNTDFVILPIQVEPDAEIYNAYEAIGDPCACTVIPDTTSGTQRKLRLLPNFTNSSHTVAYSYYKRPETLSGSGVLAIPELCEAIAWDVLASNKDFSRDSDTSQEMYLLRAKRAKRAAMAQNFL